MHCLHLPTLVFLICRPSDKILVQIIKHKKNIIHDTHIKNTSCYTYTFKSPSRTQQATCCVYWVRAKMAILLWGWKMDYEENTRFRCCAARTVCCGASLLLLSRQILSQPRGVSTRKKENNTSPGRPPSTWGVCSKRK